jgi:putative phage-type endonuclease
MYEVLCNSSDRPAWLEARRAGIGGSDAPAILGLSSFGSPLSVYASKLGAVVSEDFESELMAWGRFVEAPMMARFAEETGRACDLFGKLVRNVERPWLLATPDGLQKDPNRGGALGLVECKLTVYRASDWDEGVPAHVQAQVQHSLAATGLSYASVLVLLHGYKFRWADVERDDSFIDGLLLPELTEFWRRVEAGEPPAPDASEATRRALAALYPEDSGATVELPGELVPLDQERVALKGEEKIVKTRLAEIDAAIKLAIGDASTGVLANGASYTHRLQKRKEFVTAASSFRVLRRKGE